MKILLPEQGIIKKQEIDLAGDVTIVYGLNNCGKTSALKLMDCFLDRQLIIKFFNKEFVGNFNEPSLYIPTNRVARSIRLTEMKEFDDIESIINYKQELYKAYDLHLKMIRDYLLKLEYVRTFIRDAVYKIFHIKVSDFDVRYSDGIEDIINIYANIIWILTWDIDFRKTEEKEFQRLMSTGFSYIFVDEIEMFLHVSVQSNLIESLTSDFPACRFVFSTHSPLLLTRYRNTNIFCMEEGMLNPVCDNLYFKDLDTIYEGYFNVKELPDEVGNDIRYLGEIVLYQEEPDKEKIETITANIKNNYPNLYHKYSTWFIKARDRVDS